MLGIDPGLRLTGYALVDATRDRLSLVEAGVFRVTKGAGSTALSVSARLEELDSDFRAALKRLQPGVIAIESIFAHHKHPATA
ncbi:MAG: crossover junction endodeoxyribonuclease RuvC, partial [Phycisphaerae bacterium]